MRRGTKARSDSDSSDLTNMYHNNEGPEAVNASVLEEAATSPVWSPHSKGSKHEGDSKKEKTVTVALPGVKKSQPTVKKKRSAPADLVIFYFCFCDIRIILNTFDLKVFFAIFFPGYPQRNYEMPRRGVDSLRSKQKCGEYIIFCTNRSIIDKVFFVFQKSSQYIALCKDS